MKHGLKSSLIKRAALLVGMALLLCNVFMPIASAVTADGRGGSLTWINRARIRIDSFDFTYSSILSGLSGNDYTTIKNLGEAEFKKKVAQQYDNAVFGDDNFDDSPEYFYIAPGCSSDKASKITGGGAGLDPTKMAVRSVWLNPGSGGCIDLWPGDNDIPFTKFERYDETNKRIVFNWVNKYEIVRVDKQGTNDAASETFKVVFEDKPNLFYKTSEDPNNINARDYVDMNENKREGVYHMVDTGEFSDTNNDSLGDWFDSGVITKTYNGAGNGDWYTTVDIGDFDKSKEDGTIGESTTVDGLDESYSCEASLGAALSWAVCGLLDLVDKGLTTMYDMARSMLSIKQTDFTASEGLYEVWSYFRNIASILLVAIGLVMIIGQAVNKD